VNRGGSNVVAVMLTYAAVTVIGVTAACNVSSGHPEPCRIAGAMVGRIAPG
jgi:hypothetical protein